MKYTILTFLVLAGCTFARKQLPCNGSSFKPNSTIDYYVTTDCSIRDIEVSIRDLDGRLNMTKFLKWNSENPDRKLLAAWNYNPDFDVVLQIKSIFQE